MEAVVAACKAFTIAMSEGDHSPQLAAPLMTLFMATPSSSDLLLIEMTNRLASLAYVNGTEFATNEFLRHAAMGRAISIVELVRTNTSGGKKSGRVHAST